jgi:catechol 2,3-dioxygenase-like lactoylglutathione lyase family enzyme
MAPRFLYKGDLTCALGVRNLEATLAWFESVLGFQLIFHAKEHGWAEVGTSVPGVSIGFSEVEKPEVVGGATLVFGVADIDAARAELEAASVRFDGPTIELPGMVKLATFFDPDGHKFMLSQSLVEMAS